MQAQISTTARNPAPSVALAPVTAVGWSDLAPHRSYLVQFARRRLLDPVAAVRCQVGPAHGSHGGQGHAGGGIAGGRADLGLHGAGSCAGVDGYTVVGAPRAHLAPDHSQITLL